jgi:hypothetical protein
MPRAFKHRQRAQTIAFAAVAMVAVVGGLAIVIDAGIFFVAQRQLQAAADAGALAGAWHHPVCPIPTVGPPNDCLPGPPEPYAAAVAVANAETIKQLCGGAIAPPTISVGTPLNHLVLPRVNWIVVTVECDAGYSFGRILGLNRRLLTASAAAAIGDRAPNGDMTDFTPYGPTPCPRDKCRIARLVA